ncbi:MAG: sigma-70 family RNA polymerase sigma factor, partial [Myxococcota bacterium]
VHQAAGGDRDAQTRLLDEYLPLIQAAVRARKRRMGESARARDETRDLQQDATLRILGELDQHRWRGRSAFANWIRRLAGLEVIDAQRRNRAQKRDAAADTPLADEHFAVEGNAEERLDSRRQVEDLLRSLRGFKAEDSAALLMRRLGFTYEEVGAALSCSAEAARKRVERTEKKLGRGE